MGYVSDSILFRNLNDVEEAEFRKWARDNYDDYLGAISETWHPVVREEFDIIQKERGAK